MELDLANLLVTCFMLVVEQPSRRFWHSRSRSARCPIPRECLSLAPSSLRQVGAVQRSLHPCKCEE